MQLIINSPQEIIDLRKALSVYSKRRQMSINSINRLRERTRGGEVIPELREAQTLEDLDAIREDMVRRRQESVDWANNFIKQIDLQLQETL